MSAAQGGFAGKVAVITGGASGIGLAVARALAGRGARLVLADIEAAPLEAAVQALADEGCEVIGVRTDVGERASVQALADRAWDHFGAVHILMNNAGVVTFGPTQAATHDDWTWSMQVNLWGPIHGVEAFVPRMLAEGAGGHVVFTASFAGLVPNRDIGVYNVTKAGVVALAESLRKDLRGTPIGVSVLCPMLVESNIDRADRNRPPGTGHSVDTRSAQDLAARESRVLGADQVAELVLDGMLADRLYIHTHKEAEPLVRRRAERITAAFAHAV
ncbi:MAG TPA: SDR family NAD(P)-dependent oxidoreductase [Caulobacteraceae bacterium]|nr:SDR family NAD(P)-dependent oxidoreductase [Caulobacteraceae bacterium]